MKLIRKAKLQSYYYLVSHNIIKQIIIIVQLANWKFWNDTLGGINSLVMEK